MTTERQEFEDLRTEIESSKMGLEVREKEVEERTLALEVRDNEVKDLEDDLSKRETSVAERETSTQELEERLSATEADLVSRETTFAEKESSISERLTEAEALEQELDIRHTTITEMETSHQEREVQVNAHEEDLIQREGKYEEQDAALREWDASLQKREQEIIKHQEGLDAQSKQVDADSEVLQARVVEMETELSTFDERKAALEKMEADLADNKEGLDKATIELANLEKHLQTVESEIRDCPYCDAKDNFVRTRRLIDEAEVLDADVMDARRMLRMAQDKLDSADFDGAVKDAFDAQQSARLARSNFLKAGIKFLLSSVRKSLDSNENQGVNVSDAKRTLERAREASLEGRYEEAEQMAREADDLGRLLLSQYNEYQSLRVKAMAMITNGHEGNEHVQELIAEADGRASGGEYRRGIDTLE
ncbi:MAG: hypothetical protein KAS77_09480, partial [Thermoplasmata archaeon]|nr:hypothetical protein [Thermoplasmata archaeon]